uniref:WD repeat domain-containing protein 83 n=1 Tax=Triatoma dimidiata TaxID=72491 RepID=A0A0V0GC02_TRIDM
MDYNNLRSINCKQGAVRRVHFNIDGMYCITCGSDKTIKLWNPHNNLFLKTYSGHGNEVLDACGSCDSSHLLSGGADKTVILWDVATGKPLRRLRVHVSNVSCVKFNEESSLAFSGSIDNSVMIWDLRAFNFQPVQTLKDAKDSITSLHVSDYEIITGSLDCKIRRYDIRAGSLFMDYIGEPVICASLTQDGQCFIVSTTKNNIMLFDKSTGELLNEYSGHSIGDFYIENASDRKDRYILSGSIDGSVYCWDLIGCKIVNKLKHEGNYAVHSLHVHPTSNFLITATQSSVHLWGEKPLDEE